jgi:putative ABC transport system permease protein
VKAKAIAFSFAACGLMKIRGPPRGMPVFHRRMLKNYFVVALRNLRRQPGHAAINVFGLGVGVAVCLLIGLFVWQEQTYDRFHEHADRLHRAWIVEEFGEDADQRTFINTSTPVILAPTLEEHFPDIEAAIRLNAFESGNPVGPADRRFDEPLHFVDARFFEVFSFPLLRGDPSTALAASGRAVITTDVAERYFPDQDPMGQVLPISLEGADRAYIVSGIVEAPPVASTIQFRILLPFDDWLALVGGGSTSWHSVSPYTFVLAREGTSRPEMEERFASMVDNVIRTDEWEEYNVSYAIYLQPITDINLGRTLPDRVAPVAYRQYLSLLVIIALFVLLVAAINFVTLSLGQSTRRSREVGLRKSLGAKRAQVAGQFWGEALVLTGVALLAGVGLAALLTPVFSSLAGIELVFTLGLRTFGLIILLLVVVGLGAGAYPALVLSGFRPIEALKDKFQISGDKSLLRRGLVVVQFGMAILLIIGTLLVGRQLEYMRSAPLGFDQEHTVIIPSSMATSAVGPVVDRFRQLAEGNPNLHGVSASAFALDEVWATAGYTDADGVWRTLRFNWGDADFLDVAGVELVAGRMLDRNSAADSTRIMVNEALVREYGWETPEAAVGRSLPSQRLAPFEIVGVVRDFHFSSLREEIQPLAYMVNPTPFMGAVSDVSAPTSSIRKLHIQVDAADTPATIGTLRRTWGSAAPDVPFNYYFLDEAVQAQYVQEARLARIASAASMLAVVIASLGLFALATLSVTRRRKEVGVRKVLGASTAGLVALLSRDFMKLVGVAFAVAAPVAYLGVSRWLETFAYRIDPGVDVFAASGLLAIAVAFAAVSYHAVRAAASDPVDALRSE